MISKDFSSNIHTIWERKYKEYREELDGHIQLLNATCERPSTPIRLTLPNMCHRRFDHPDAHVPALSLQERKIHRDTSFFSRIESISFGWQPRGTVEEQYTQQHASEWLLREFLFRRMSRANGRGTLKSFGLWIYSDLARTDPRLLPVEESPPPALYRATYMYTCHIDSHP